mmetsp:Transcript_5225/g.6949  ORF Transcript_5225/g.6949 Transcript_5225/m.6949 type:complete len:464 (-) Transcript_5225:149-1540(-)
MRSGALRFRRLAVNGSCQAHGFRKSHEILARSLQKPFSSTSRQGESSKFLLPTVSSCQDSFNKFKVHFLLAAAAAGTAFTSYSYAESLKEEVVSSENGDGSRKKKRVMANDGSQFYIPPSDTSKMKVFSGNGNWHLANEISMHLGTTLGRATVKRFADGEVSVNIHDNVRGKDVFVIQPVGPPVNENLMELLLMISTLRRASARKITAVIPYFGYSRQSNREDGKTPIAAADVAKMLSVAGADRIVAIDLHNAQIAGFFGPETPVDNLDVSGIAIPYFETKFLQKPVIVSPDANGAARAKSFRDKLIHHGMDASLAVLLDHNQTKRGEAKEEDDDYVDANDMELVGDVRGRDCVIFDDMVDSGKSITRCTKKLKQLGAKRVFAFATHGLFLSGAYDRIEKSDLIEVVCVNTIPLQTTQVAGVSSWTYSSKIHQLSVAALLAEAIRRIQNKQSLSYLFDNHDSK